ncbi:MAG TPA: enolase C-terminal domain-like protein, partial [Polyangiaceae bacterium]
QALELTLRADDLLGLGEACPLPAFSTETFEEARVELASLQDFEMHWPKTAENCRPWLDGQLEGLRCHVPSTRFAIEGAFLDLAAKYFELPLASLLARMHGRDAPSGTLELSKLLPGNDDDWTTAASRALARGYKTLKIKLGFRDDFDRELASLLVLREHVGPAVKLRLDPNQNWLPNDVARNLQQLTSIDPELVEEPVTADTLAQLESSPVSLAIDESLRSADVLDEFTPHMDRLRLRAVVIKPALLGLVRALDIAKHAKGLGLDVIVTHLFDGPIGHATASSLALAVGTSKYAQGLAPHPGLSLAPERRVSGVCAGYLRLGDVAGLPLHRVPEC